jgi:CO dehydrogenase nickel-insertion accessory protein CooC1
LEEGLPEQPLRLLSVGRAHACGSGCLCAGARGAWGSSTRRRSRSWG